MFAHDVYSRKSNCVRSDKQRLSHATVFLQSEKKCCAQGFLVVNISILVHRHFSTVKIVTLYASGSAVRGVVLYAIEFGVQKSSTVYARGAGGSKYQYRTQVDLITVVKNALRSSNKLVCIIDCIGVEFCGVE